MKTISIIGRPNVGKSTLFNRLACKKISIITNIPGTTRDRVYAEIKGKHDTFLLVDTGGLVMLEDDKLVENINKQVEAAIDESDLIIFLVDAYAGIIDDDEIINRHLKKKGKNVILVVNKIDKVSNESERVYEFYKLGYETFIEVSAEHALGIAELQEKIFAELDIEKKEVEEVEEVGTKIAIIGKPNVGKSSIINALLKEERLIVSDIPGTTRDSIDLPFKYGDQDFILIDTAGIRKKTKVDSDLEYYSVLRSIKAIKRSDLVVFVLDYNTGITEQDTKILGLAYEEQKPLIVVVNKFDRNDEVLKSKMIADIKDKAKFLDFAPIIFTSALRKRNLNEILIKSSTVFNEYQKQITTGTLNSLLRELTISQPHPIRKCKNVTINYITQVRNAPPVFALFTNFPDLVHFSYLRYLENNIRSTFGFEGVPIKFEVKRK